MKTKAKKKETINSVKKQRTKKIIIASVAVSAAGILTYFGWQYYKKRKDSSSGTDLSKLLQKTGTDAASYSSSNSDVVTPKPKKGTVKTPRSNSSGSDSGSGFPLKRGSKGDNVRMLQQALINKYGKNILPRYGADGDFGAETVAALKKAGLPAQVSESTFNVLTQGTRPDTTNLGKDLYDAASSGNFSKVITLLKQMQTVDDYTKANDVFKQNRLGAVRQTIVNGLLSSFSSTAQQQALRMEFLRIGLQYDGNKWSLSGFDGRPIVTKAATTVWLNASNGVKVPARMVLGNEVSRRLDYTLFENNGKYFLVNTQSVQYL